MKHALVCLLFVYSAVGATHTVSMTNPRFTPPNLTINLGDTVTWNNSQGFHDTVSGSSGVPSGVWNSNNQFRRLMNPGESFSFTFNSAGTFPYYCTPHWTVGMVGTIRVVAPNLPPNVSILNPVNQANFPAPADITIQASASDPDGTVRQVEFFMNGAPIATVAAPPYSVVANNLGPGNYTFAAVATDNANATGSASVSVTVSGQEPAITTGPQSQTVNAGEDVLFTVQATGSPPLSYQWFLGPTTLALANATSLLLTNVTSADSGVYTVQVSNAFGVTSASATLSVTNPPSGTAPAVTTHPQSQTVNPGSHVTFTAAAIGTGPLMWQWFRDGSALVDATNASLELPNVTLAHAGTYFAFVSNAFGSAISSNATLTVCDFTLSKGTAFFEAAGGSDSVVATTAADCAWTVNNTNTWVIITSANSGVGSGIVTFIVLSNATRTARSAALLIAGNTFTVTQAAAIFPARNDFNHDGFTDILWQNADGRVSVWLMNGILRVGALPLRNGRPAPRGARITGTHDFNLDGNEDILWQHTIAPLEIWFMNGTNYLRSEFISPAPALGRVWQVAGLGDFNHDRHMDILLRHRDGYLLLWYLKGRQFIRQELLLNGEPVPPAWRIAGVADLNHDGHADILWQSADSALVVWFMRDSAPFAGPPLSRLPRINARIVGLNDLNQDGQLDLIWRHPAGNLSVWWMNQTNRTGSALIQRGQIVPTAWTFAAPGQ